MRFLFITQAQFPVPREEVPALTESFVAWWERYRDRWESAGFFVEGNGGGGICNVADEAEFHRMVMEWPFTPYSRNEAHLLVDMDVALGRWQEILATIQGGD